MIKIFNHNITHTNYDGSYQIEYQLAAFISYKRGLNINTFICELVNQNGQRVYRHADTLAVMSIVKRILLEEKSGEGINILPLGIMNVHFISP